MKTLPASASESPACDSLALAEELCAHTQIATRARVAAALIFGQHYIWRDGKEYYTPAGLRLIAEAHDADRDPAAALVCRRRADALQPPPAAAAPSLVTAPADFESGEEEFLAKRWDLRVERAQPELTSAS
jgi:hypothetical protein